MAKVGQTTSFTQGQFPFTYLGCPLCHSRKKKEHYTKLIKKVKGKLHFWKGKLLSFGGKAILIKSVVQSVSIHLLLVLTPPKCVINDLHKLFAGYFLSNKEKGRSRH